MRKSESPKIAVNQPSGYASANSCDYENCYFKEASASLTDWVLWHSIIRLGSWSCLYLPVQFYQWKSGWRWCSLFWNIWTCFIEVSIGASIPLCIIIGYSKTPLASNLVFMPLHPYIIEKQFQESGKSTFTGKPQNIITAAMTNWWSIGGNKWVEHDFQVSPFLAAPKRHRLKLDGSQVVPGLEF